ncbi:MAG: hypothetical protein ACI4VE_01355 [Clostridia bacterium]
MATKQKNIWVLLVFLLSGIVIRRITWRISRTSRFPLVAFLW